ncbi:MAG: DUF3617 domain-containing protein [Betaproteobacteria bacterium]
MRSLLLLAGMLCAAAALAQDAPKRKSGIWQLKMTSAMLPQPMITQQCVTESTDDLARPAPGGPRECSKPSVSRQGASTVVETECKVEGSMAKTRAVLTGDFASAYKADVTINYQPPLQGMGEQKMAIEGRWMGPCK